ncbi:MAG: serine/threonine-protein kinase PknK, partial [Myxococcales bacterium]|nr:serine/threonine-protein kinase PknK [Myxococcales bacterium]
MPSASAFKGTARFEPKSCLGAGGMGIVYEVFDREIARRVALKTLRHMTPQRLLRFKAEFRALRDIRHPNLVRLGELYEQQGQWFFTMELLEGAELLERLGRQAPELQTAPLPDLVTSEADYRTTAGQAVDGARLRHAFAQLFGALAALHAAGKIHRDVKPSNIWLADDDRLVLLDFGLAIDEGSTTVEGAGTAAYMAPEQAAGQLVSPAADCYAAGVVLFEALTGRRPFIGSVRRVLADKQQRAAPTVLALAPDAPADLARIADALLAADPASRPTAAALVRQLGSAQHLSRWLRDSRDLKPLATSARLAQLVGRDIERARLLDHYDQTLRSQRARCVLLVGPAGSGKRTILSALFRQLSSEPTPPLVLRSRCMQQEHIPYQAIDGLMDDLCHALVGRDEQELVEMLAPLGHAFPQVAALLPPHTLTLRRRGRARAARARDALLLAAERLLSRLSAQQPLVLSIHDLHHIDDDSLELLAQLGSASEPLSLLVVGTVDAGELSTTRLETLCVRLGAERVLLDPLALDRARQLFTHVAREHGVDDGEARALADELVLVPQQPLAISELARSAAAGGAERVLRSGGLPSLSPTRELLEEEQTLQDETPQDQTLQDQDQTLQDDSELATTGGGRFEDVLVLEDADLEELPDSRDLQTLPVEQLLEASEQTLRAQRISGTQRTYGAAHVHALQQFRIAELDLLPRLLLELLAVSQTPLSASALARAARAEGSSEGDVAAALAVLELEALIAPAIAGRLDTYELAQRSLAEVILRRVDAPRVTALRALLRGPLVERVRPGSSRGEFAADDGSAGSEFAEDDRSASSEFDAQALAAHFERVGRQADAALLFERAAEQALAALAFERAVELFSHASKLAADAEQRQRLMLRLAEAQIGCGRGDAAALALLQAADAAPDEPQRLDLLTAAAEQLLRAGARDEGLALLRRVLEAVGRPLPANRPGAMLSLLSRLESERQHEAARDDDDGRSVRRSIETCWLASSALGLVDLALAADFQAHLHAEALLARWPLGRALALIGEAQLLAVEPAQRDEAARTLARVRASSAELGAPADRAYVLALCQSADALLSLCRGAFREAAQAARGAARELASGDGSSWHLENAQLIELWALATLGDVRALAARVSGGFRRARRRGDRRSMRDLCLGPAVLGWLGDDAPEAARQAIDALGHADDKRAANDALDWPAAFALWARASVELYEGQAGAAHARLEALWPALP